MLFSFSFTPQNIEYLVVIIKFKWFLMIYPWFTSIYWYNPNFNPTVSFFSIVPNTWSQRRLRVLCLIVLEAASVAVWDGWCARHVSGASCGHGMLLTAVGRVVAVLSIALDMNVAIGSAALVEISTIFALFLGVLDWVVVVALALVLV